MNHIVPSATILVLAMGIGGCGSSEPTPPAPRLTSPLVLSEPPTYVSGHGPIGSAEFFFGGGISGVEILPEAGTGVSKFSVSIPGEQILMALVHLAGGTEYLLVGAIDTNEKFVLHRVHDSDDDGVVDASTLTSVFDSGTEKIYGMSLAVEGDRWYLLDRRCQDVRLILDTDSDGLADAWKSTPFAKSADHSELLETRHLIKPSSGTGVDAYSTLHEQPEAEPGRVELRDSNSDDVSDTATTIAPKSITPVIYGHLFSGQDKVKVQADYGSGQTAQVWDVDGSGDPSNLLGSILLSDDEFTEISLSRALVLDEEIVIKFSDPGAEEEVLEVGEDEPQYIDLSTVNLPIGQVNTIEVEGYGFTSTTTYTLETKDEQSITIAATFNSSTSVTLAVPILTAASLGNATLKPVDDGDTLDFIQVLVCD